MISEANITTRRSTALEVLAGLLVVIVVISLTPCVLAESVDDVKFAVIADKASNLHQSPLLSLLEVKLSQRNDVQLLERTEINKILQEQSVNIKSLQHESASWRIVKACAVIMTVLSSPCVAVADSSIDPCQRLAILSPEKVQASGLSDLLTVQMQSLAGVELVERDMLQKVLDEVALSMMLGAEQSENRRKAGALLKADVLVLLSLEEAGDKKKVKVIISDCSNGARLHIGWVLFSDSKLEDTCSNLTTIVSGTLERFKEGVKQIIGVSHFVSKNLIHDYDYLQAGYAYLLENALISSPGVAVIEIEEARSIRHESELAGEMKSDRIVPIFVEGDFLVQNAVLRKERKVNMTVSISDSSGPIKQIERQNLVMDEVTAFITGDVAMEILELSKSPLIKMLDREKQFLALVNRASEFARLGAWEHSTELREAAVLLNPDSVEQRTKLVDEYRRTRKWRLNLEHIEYLIYNHMINRTMAIELSLKFLRSLPFSRHADSNRQRCIPEELCKKDFLRRVYPEVLELKPSSDQTCHQQEECTSWYSLLIKYALCRLNGYYLDKEDLAFLLDLHNNVVPEGMPPSGRFINFLLSHFQPENWKRTDGYGWGGPYYFSMQEFLDFLTAMRHSERTLSSFYGRYALLYHEYYQKKNQNRNMGDLYDEVELVLKEYKKFKFPEGQRGAQFTQDLIFQRIKDMKKEIERRLNEPKGQNRPDRQKKGCFGTKKFQEKQMPEVKSRLVFEKIVMNVKDLFGNIKPMYKESWPSARSGQVGMRNILKCGDSLDVMWSGGAILFMKEKGLLEEILVDGQVFLNDLKWDGENVWIGTRKDGIWLLDTSGEMIAKIRSESGLPPAEKGIVLCPIERGSILAVGSFGPHKRGWCAIVEFSKGKASVNVFHEATLVPTHADYRNKELEKNPTFSFSPRWIHEYKEKEKDNRIFLVGRASFGFGYLRCPLEIDLNKLSARVSSFKLHPHEVYSSSYFSKNGILFECGPTRVTCFSDPKRLFANGKVKKTIYHYQYSSGSQVFPGYLIEYEDRVYVPGKIWFRFDPKTLEEEQLVRSEPPLYWGLLPSEPCLPEPYKSLSGFGVSGHYGLIGWDEDQNFYQISITEKEHIIE